MIEDIACSIRRARKTFTIGNGGSAANAMHLANELISLGIPAQCLCSDAPTLTAIANDYGYEQVFSRQLECLGSPRDCLIAFSGSGRSPNIQRALASARRIGMSAFLISHGLVALDMQASEEEQVVIIHKLLRLLRCELRRHNA